MGNYIEDDIFGWEIWADTMYSFNNRVKTLPSGQVIKIHRNKLKVSLW